MKSFILVCVLFAWQTTERQLCSISLKRWKFAKSRQPFAINHSKKKNPHTRFRFQTRPVGVENPHVKQETCAYCEKLLLLAVVAKRRFSENFAILVETQRKLYWVLCVREWYRRVAWFWISWNLFPFDYFQIYFFFQFYMTFTKPKLTPNEIRKKYINFFP